MAAGAAPPSLHFERFRANNWAPGISDHHTIRARRRPGSSTSGTSSTPSTCGASPARQAAACCCASRTTIGSAADRSTSGPFIEDLDVARLRRRRRTGRVKASAARSMRRRSSTSAVEVLVYACECSRSEIADGEPARRGAAVSRDLPRQGTAGAPAGWASESRLAAVDRAVPRPAARPAGAACPFEDNAAMCCCAIATATGRYQFAVTVDDFRRSGSRWAVRGDDPPASTGRQLQLARLLGRDRAAGRSSTIRC